MIIKVLAILLYPWLTIIGYAIGFVTWPVVSGFIKGYSAALKIAYSEYEEEVKACVVKEKDNE